MFKNFSSIWWRRSIQVSQYEGNFHALVWAEGWSNGNLEFGYCVPFLGWDPATRAPPDESLTLSLSRLLDLLSESLSSPSSYNLETWSFCSSALRLKLVRFLPVSEVEGVVLCPKNLFDMNCCSRGSCFQKLCPSILSLFAHFFWI